MPEPLGSLYAYRTFTVWFLRNVCWTARVFAFCCRWFRFQLLARLRWMRAGEPVVPPL